MSLIGKKILVVGGNGYVGNYFVARLVKQAATVYAMSRKGLKYEYPENAAVDWLIGDVLKPGKYKEQINSADIIVHTVGTLFDSSVTKGTQAGGPGTYEQVNRDTLAAVLSHLQQPKKIVYLSSNAHPPFLERYLTTKHQAEDLLFSSQNEGYSLRPGFIHNSQHRVWSVPLNYGIKAWNKVYPYVHGIAPPQTFLQKAIQQFKQGETTPLDELGDSLIEVCLNGYPKKILQVQDIHEASKKYKQTKQA